MTPPFHQRPTVVIALTAAGLITLAKYAIGVLQLLHQYAMTREGNALLLIVAVLLTLVTLVVTASRH
jgi:hypothetical protein